MGIRVMTACMLMSSNILISFQPCPTLCDHMDCVLPDSSVHGIHQGRILEWLPCPPPGDPSDPVIKSASLMSPALASRFFTTSITREATGRNY